MSKMYNTWNQSAVSETIGFVIMMGIIFTGIALVTLYGYPTLLQAEENANTKNMEKNMIVLQNDIKNLAYKSVPYEETGIQVSGGTLSVIRSSTAALPIFTITKGNGSNVISKPGELQYRPNSEDAVISLENGAVIVSYWNQGGSAMLSEPRWFYDEDPLTHKHTFIISLIEIDSESDLSQTGIGNIGMELTSTSIDNGGGPVQVTYTPDVNNDHRTAWRNYFTSLGMSGSGDTYTMNNVDNLTIKRYKINVKNL